MKKSNWIILGIVIVALIIFFYPKSCGESSGKPIYSIECSCIGIKSVLGWPDIADITKTSCYGICLKNNCKTNITEPLVGGCAGVHMSYWQECCNNWANENNIFHIQCVGNWTVENNSCVWKCK